jgi:hypothetical protein
MRGIALGLILCLAGSGCGFSEQVRNETEDEVTGALEELKAEKKECKAKGGDVSAFEEADQVLQNALNRIKEVSTDAGLKSAKEMLAKGAEMLAKASEDCRSEPVLPGDEAMPAEEQPEEESDSFDDSEP